MLANETSALTHHKYPVYISPSSAATSKAVQNKANGDISLSFLKGNLIPLQCNRMTLSIISEDQVWQNKTIISWKESEYEQEADRTSVSVSKQWIRV